MSSCRDTRKRENVYGRSCKLGTFGSVYEPYRLCGAYLGALWFTIQYNNCQNQSLSGPIKCKVFAVSREIEQHIESASRFCDKQHNIQKHPNTPMTEYIYSSYCIKLSHLLRLFISSNAICN